jgi:hypothetical protein
VLQITAIKLLPFQAPTRLEAKLYLDTRSVWNLLAFHLNRILKFSATLEVISELLLFTEENEQL